MPSKSKSTASKAAKAAAAATDSTTSSDAKEPSKTTRSMAAKKRKGDDDIKRPPQKEAKPDPTTPVSEPTTTESEPTTSVSEPTASVSEETVISYADCTHTPITKAEAARNGRFKGREIHQWGGEEGYLLLFLVLVYEVERDGRSVPWNYVAHRTHPKTTGTALKQTICRARKKLLTKGWMVPPTRTEAQNYDPLVRGYVRDGVDENGAVKVRKVTWTEGFENPKRIIHDAFDNISQDWLNGDDDIPKQLPTSIAEDASSQEITTRIGSTVAQSPHTSVPAKTTNDPNYEHDEGSQDQWQDLSTATLDTTMVAGQNNVLEYENKGTSNPTSFIHDQSIESFKLDSKIEQAKKNYAQGRNGDAADKGSLSTAASDGNDFSGCPPHQGQSRAMLPLDNACNRQIYVMGNGYASNAVESPWAVTNLGLSVQSSCGQTVKLNINVSKRSIDQFLLLQGLSVNGGLASQNAMGYGSFTGAAVEINLNITETNINLCSFNGVGLCMQNNPMQGHPTTIPGATGGNLTENGFVASDMFPEVGNPSFPGK